MMKDQYGGPRPTAAPTHACAKSKTKLPGVRRRQVNPVKRIVATLIVVGGAHLCPPSFADDGNFANPSGRGPLPKPFKADQALSEFAENLSARKKNQKRPVFIGEGKTRDNIKNMLEKVEPTAAYLLGPSSAGKTSLMKSLAYDLPGREVWSLRVNNLKEGTHYQGSLETRLKSFFEAFVKDPRRILYIDEFHTITQIDGLVDLLKPLISEKQITLIGSTTEDEFSKILKGPHEPLANRAPTFLMEHHTFEKVLNILRAKKTDLEDKYNLVITDAALVRTVKLAFLYYDGAHSRVVESLVERAIQRKKANADLTRVHFDTHDVNDQIQILEANLVLFKREFQHNEGLVDTTSIERQILTSQRQLDGLKSQYQAVQTEREHEALNTKFMTYQRLVRDLERAIKIDPSASLEITLSQAKAMRAKTSTELLKYGNGGPPLVDPAQLTAEDMGRFIAGEIGLTSEVANETDGEKLDRLRRNLRGKLFGQDHAIEELIEELELRLSKLEPIEKPITIMVTGPPGVGKSTFEEVIAEFYFGDKSRVVGIEMNSLGNVGPWALWGSARGYRGSEDGSKFEAVRRRPFSLVSFREFEKASPAVYDSMLQAIGKGEQADSRGNVINFRNTIMIFDGNLTGDWATMREAYFAKHYTLNELEDAFKLGRGALANKTAAEMDEYVMSSELDRRGFSRAFQDRIDVKLVFNSTSRETAKAVLKYRLDEQKKNAETEHQIDLDFGNIGDVLIDHYFKAGATAREYKRLLRRQITRPLKDLLQLKKYKPNTHVAVAFKPTEGKTGDATGNIEFVVQERQFVDEGGERALRTVRKESFSGAELFMRAVDKPALATGRTAGEAGRAPSARTEPEPETSSSQGGRKGYTIHPRPKTPKIH